MSVNYFLIKYVNYNDILLIIVTINTTHITSNQFCRSSNFLFLFSDHIIIYFLQISNTTRFFISFFGEFFFNFYSFLFFLYRCYSICVYNVSKVTKSSTSCSLKFLPSFGVLFRFFPWYLRISNKSLLFQLIKSVFAISILFVSNTLTLIVCNVLNNYFGKFLL